MIRWLWPLLAAFSFTVSFSALRFERIGHDKFDLNAPAKWQVGGFEFPLGHASDFFVYAVPLTAAACLACALLCWQHVRHSRSRYLLLRLPPVGPAAGRGRLERMADQTVRAVLAAATLGLGIYATVHLFRQFLDHGIFDHNTGSQVLAPGLLASLLRWPPGDLRYGAADGVTWYPVVQAWACLALVLGGLAVTVAFLRALGRARARRRVALMGLP